MVFDIINQRRIAWNGMDEKKCFWKLCKWCERRIVRHQEDDISSRRDFLIGCGKRLSGVGHVRKTCDKYMEVWNYCLRLGCCQAKMGCWGKLSERFGSGGAKGAPKLCQNSNLTPISLDNMFLKFFIWPPNFILINI